MKNIIFAMFVMALSTYSFSQNKIKQAIHISTGNEYTSGITMPVYYIDAATNKEESRKAFKGLDYSVIYKKDGKAFIEFKPVTSDNSTTENNSDYINVNTWNAANYYLKEDDLKEVNRLKTKGLVTGTLLAPIKMRPKIDEDMQNGISEQPWQLSTDIGLGQFIGYRVRIAKYNPYYLTFPVTLGTSLLSINSDNTTKDETDPATTLGLSWSSGLIFDINKVQIGLLFGKDYAPGVAGADWIYNRKTWFSFGIGLNFSSNDRDL